jgi:hypothetical protein
MRPSVDCKRTCKAVSASKYRLDMAKKTCPTISVVFLIGNAGQLRSRTWPAWVVA